VVEVDQTVSSNAYKIKLNGFILVNTQGLKNNFKEVPAGHP
jgi:hypothetical protein